MSEILMACGHTANGFLTLNDKQVPCCVICDCIKQAKEMPSLEKRRARCAFYGQHKSQSCYWNKMDKHTFYPPETPDSSVCQCETDSDYTLPFFEYAPLKKYDEFYCGCAGWD